MSFHDSERQLLAKIVIYRYPHSMETVTDVKDQNSLEAYTVKGFNFAVLKFHDFLDGDISRWF